MSDLEEDSFVDTDSSEDEEQYSKFLSSVAQLDSTQRVKPALRKEISTEVSEYNLQKGTSDTGVVNVKELANILKKTAKHASITNKLIKVTEKSKTLPKPLEKHAEDKLKRMVGFEGVQKQLKRWNAVVEKNNLKDHLVFPLANTSMKLETSNSFHKQFKNPTPLEEEITKFFKEDKPLKNNDEEDDFPLTLEEMLEKRKEMARLRAKLSYREAKAQRQNKIKSKKYHRIMKQEKLRQQLKDFEMLQKTDPTKALEKLAELDKNRALERASLRHRNTGQWAKNMTVKAKYDIESRKILAEQLKMSREIAKKVHLQDSSDDEETPGQNQKADVSKTKSMITQNDNPWSLDVSKEVQEFVADYKKYWNEKNNELNKDQMTNNSNKSVSTNCNEHKTSATTESFNWLEGEQELVTNSDGKGNTDKKNSINKIDNNLNDSNSTNNNNNKKEDSTKKKSRRKKKLNSSSDTNGNLVKNTEELKQKVCGLLTVRPTSGLWVVTNVIDAQENETSNKSENRKRKGDNIDNLFSDLEGQLMKKAEKKVQAINKQLKRSEKTTKKLKVKEDKEPKLSSSLRGNFNQRPDEDVGLIEGDADEVNEAQKNVPVDATNGDQSKPPAIDPTNFIQVKPKNLGMDIPEYINTGDDAIDDEEFRSGQQKIIEEAFGDDDVIAEFEEAKNKEGNETELKISTALPGWGEWGGTGLVLSKRKRKRFTTVKLPPRKDKNKADIIINEDENPNVRNHLVKAVPYPFKTAEAFEASMRAPIGREWIPETAHHKLIQKPIETKLGAIIEPMGEEEIVNDLKKAYRTPFKGKKKMNKTS
ncbi:hypothetical protein RUM43_002279 [Polyplax serrata]|uniref:U3 small nucleolar RNA-associated protein 14 homolog A n=1 Tax=Polyplax serrata TaxID=468196 RepID=A0AAN8S5V9_POLSC